MQRRCACYGVCKTAAEGVTVNLTSFSLHKQSLDIFSSCGKSQERCSGGFLCYSNK